MAKAITDATMDAQVNGNGRVEVDESKVTVMTREITAEDFLQIFAEETIEFPMSNGTHAMLRSLTRPEVIGLMREYKGKEDDLAFGALKKSLASPQLTPEQWAVVENGKAGPIFKMGKVVMQLSGMTDDDKSMGEDGASS